MGIIKQAFTVLFCSLLASGALLVGCSSENNSDKRYDEAVGVAKTQPQTEEKAAASSSAASADASASAPSAAAQVSDASAPAPLQISANNVVKNDSGKVLYNPNKKYGSLWESELFSDQRFQLKIKLSASEQKEAKILARSFESHMERGKYFMHYLLSELKARNLPAELAAIPLVESGFKLRAKSHANAHGPWQFTRRTGKSFGLTVTSSYDEFYDFIASTEASLTYLEHLYQALDQDWELAFVAYNQGEFGVKKSIRRAKAAGVKKINAQTIPLTKTARTYLSRVRCYADILHHPESYGVKHPEVSDHAAFKRIELAGTVNSMKEVAKLSGVDLETLKHLNAGYLTDSLKTNKDHGLLVPVENVLKLETAIAMLSPKDTANQRLADQGAAHGSGAADQRTINPNANGITRGTTQDVALN